MNIATIDIRPFALDLVKPLQTAAGTIETRDGFVVRFETVDGTVGLGEATPLLGWTESIADCRDALESAREALLSGKTAPPNRQETPAASHAFELARLDLEAQANGVPLYRHLGGNERVDAVPVNATIGDGTPAETARKATTATEDGFRCVKLKVGARSVERDSERITAVRDAVGPHVEIRCDANAAWNRDQASRAFDALEAFDVSYVEQPLTPDDLDGHAELRGGEVGVALDESLARKGPRAILDREAADVLICKPQAFGGLTPILPTTQHARQKGVKTVITTTIDAVIARTGAVHLAASVPPVPACGLATAELLAKDVAPDPAPVENGQISVPQGKGLGVEEGWDA